MLNNEEEHNKWMNDRMSKGYSFKYIKGKHRLNIKVICVETKEEFILDHTDETYYKFVAERLWSILDDIDTSSDVIKPTSEKGYKIFYEKTMERVSNRFNYLTSDGYNLYRPTLDD
jgi:hypothetical protein